MFVLESTYDGAGTIVEVKPLTDNEAAAVGEGFKFSSGKLTKASVSDKPAYIGIQKVAAGTNKTVEAISVRQDQVWLADYVTASTNTPAVGATHCIDANGLKVDADKTKDTSEVAGKATIISVDTAKKKCRVKFE
jgi:hypothetical protein